MEGLGKGLERGVRNRTSVCVNSKLMVNEAILNDTFKT